MLSVFVLLLLQLCPEPYAEIGCLSALLGQSGDYIHDHRTLPLLRKNIREYVRRKAPLSCATTSSYVKVVKS
ncbi:hypothetical protein PENSPDRAFT_451658 [Peniophora sp. CONT]|nr:hypothetical protein PENSPDRAFT_451658 [Peniophora sp. CONT]